MNCYNHVDRPAIGLCKRCNKGLFVLRRPTLRWSGHAAAYSLRVGESMTWDKVASFRAARPRAAQL
jgi:hypothetical protein